jgi:hypothetical protein
LYVLCLFYPIDLPSPWWRGRFAVSTLCFAGRFPTNAKYRHSKGFFIGSSVCVSREIMFIQHGGAALSVFL